ncbi:MAG: hypothetical protein GY940_14805, partial [bacterium]|nr:hypothetical protein [bacterium]
KTLVGFLNDLGVMLYFKDVQLKNMQVLNPRWITDGVYRIINYEELAEQHGVLDLDTLDQILVQEGDQFGFPAECHGYIIGLMEKFELCYRLDADRVLVPDLLDKAEPDFQFDEDQSVKFIVQYDFLPLSVIPRFIVNMHKDIKKNLQWRKGVVLEDKQFGSTAVVRADYESKRIYIDVNGGQKRDYFATILLTLRRINHSFEKLETIELIPMPDEPWITAEYQQLIRYEERGIDLYLPGRSDKEYKVKDLLGTIVAGEPTEEKMLQILKKLKTDNDTIESLLKKASNSFTVQPNIFGIGLDVKALAKKLFKKK